MAVAPLLEVSGLCVDRGVLRVVDDVFINVDPGSCVGLLGLNGAGKSSLLAALSGLIPPASGTVRLDGAEIQSLPAWERAKHGLALVPSGRQLWPSMTVEDTLLVGAHLQTSKSATKVSVGSVFDHFPILAEKRRQKAQELSGGQQQMLAIGRALMARPKVLLLDEPSEGLAPVIVDQVFDVVSTLRDDEGLTILLAEQNGGMVEICNAVLLMQEGRIGSIDTDEVNLAQLVFDS